jgi:hypothetical protein
VYEQRRTSRVRVLRDQLRVGAGGEGGGNQRQREGGPDRATRLRADLADQRVDAAAEDVADDEEEEQPGSDPPRERDIAAGQARSP